MRAHTCLHVICICKSCRPIPSSMWFSNGIKDLSIIPWLWPNIWTKKSKHRLTIYTYIHIIYNYIDIYTYTHIIIYNMYIVFKYVLHLGWWSPTQMAGEDGSEAVLVDICERQLMLVHESRGAIWWRRPKTHRIPRWHNLTPLEAIINSATGGMGCV